MEQQHTIILKLQDDILRRAFGATFLDPAAAESYFHSLDRLAVAPTSCTSHP